MYEGNVEAFRVTTSLSMRLKPNKEMLKQEKKT